jgi:hypothetical protein
MKPKRDCPGCRWHDKTVKCSCDRWWCQECMREHARLTGCKVIYNPQEERERYADYHRDQLLR